MKKTTFQSKSLKDFTIPTDSHFQKLIFTQVMSRQLYPEVLFVVGLVVLYFVLNI